VRVAAVAAATAFAAATWAPAALAADGDVQVVNTETIQTYTDATGAVETSRVYEQLALTGTGSVDFTNPIETDGLRNLDAFGGVDVKDGNQIVQESVDGEKRLRSVSNFDGDLPLEINVKYFLDGAAVEPGDVVGADGQLEVLYTVKNVTAAPQELTFDDGMGGTVTKTVEVPIPMVGSLTTLAPSNFTDVASKQANMAGDGKGGTKLSFTMTLFPPLGSDTAEFGYTANITDGVVPRADISALPVNPLDSPTFASAAKSYKGGADTGIELADGSTQIDENLLKLRDGAGDLLAGLIKLRDGSNQLYLGLAGDAVPGARKLADGMGQLDDGVGQLDDGMGKLSAGSKQLADGTGTASAGSKKLHAGAGTLSDGLGQLSGGALELDNGAGQILDGQKALRNGLRLLESGVIGLPDSVRKQLATNASYQALLAGMQKVVDGIGKPTDVTGADGTPATLFGGLNAVKYGLRNPVGYTSTDCAVGLTGGTPVKCGAMDAVQFVAGQLSTGATDLNQLKPVLGILNGVNGAGDTPCPGYPNYAPPPTPPTNACQAVATLYYALFGTAPAPLGAQAKVTAAAGALTDVYSKVDAGILPGIDKMKVALNNPSANPICSVGAATAAPGDDCGIQQAVAFFKLSIPLLVDSITASISQTLLAGISVPSTGVCDPDAMTLLCGANALVAGSKDLKGGTAKLLAGSGELDAGGMLLYEKLGELAAGLGKIDDGAGQLADGAAKAKAGTTQLADGSGQLADGSNQLADGLGTAADGSRQITDGLTKAADGAPKLVDGAQRLSDEGTKKLIEAGEDTAQNYGQMYATISAGAERADAEKMAYGAPEGALGLTAYSFVIQGEDGDTGRNLARGLSGLVLLGAGAGAFALRRRFV
jgi:putative membrane protein